MLHHTHLITAVVAALLGILGGCAGTVRYTSGGKTVEVSLNVPKPGADAKPVDPTASTLNPSEH